MVNDTTRLLGLDGLVVDRVELNPDGIPVVGLSTADEQARCCPECGVSARRVKQWVTTRPRDLPVAGRPTRLRWRKRRWHCDQRGCPRRTFTEQVPQVPARARLTTRLRQAAGAAVADANRTIVQAARDHGISWPVVAAASPPDLAGVYAHWSRFVAWAAAEPPSSPLVEFAPADLGPPSPQPRQIFAIGLNYRDHAVEAGFAVPEGPTVFTKFVSSLGGPHTEVVLPDGEVDWEVELVVVIGTQAGQVTAENAWGHVAGLTVGQDLSERRLQKSGPAPQFSLAKSYPGFGPTGPYLVTPDELPEPGDLAIGCRVNGEEMQKGRTSRLIFGLDQLIARHSAVTTLYPGEVIFTGTPAGVGAAPTESDSPSESDWGSVQACGW